MAVGGIVGIASYERQIDPHSPALIQMLSRIAHRGAAGRSTWTSPHVALGSAYATSAGQPLIRELGERRWVILYDGYLTDAAELRDRVASRGHQLQSHSDAELLLLAYIEFGPDLLRSVDGAFALAICDEANRRLFLARDRLGIKPLFYSQAQEGLLFASEIKALLAHPAVEPTLSPQGLAELLLLYPARRPGHPVFAQVEELLPGHWLEFGPEQIHSQRYWSLQTRPHTAGLEETADHLRSLLTVAVRRQLQRLQTEQPLASLLSGGLDSSAVTTLATQLRREQGQPSVHTYSLSFAANEQHFRPNEFHPSQDDPYVEQLVAHLGTEHQRVPVQAGEILKQIGRVVAARDLPGMGDVDAGLLLLARSVAAKTPVALSGEGADELFGGYRWALEPGMHSAHRFPWAVIGESEHWLLRPEIVAAIRPTAYREEAHGSLLAEVADQPAESPEERQRRHLLYLLLTQFLPSLLERSDRIGMAAGLEIRFPFCDRELVEYVWSIPWHLKQADGQAKGILRRAVADILPPAITARTKSPFPACYDPVLVNSLRHALQRTLAEPAPPLLQIFQREAVLALIQGPRHTATFAYAMLLSFLVQCDLWLRHYRVRLL